VSPELTAAIAAARAAGALQRRYFRRTPRVETKPDDTPVTAADRRSELVVRRILEAALPESGFLGEEGGALRPDASVRWIVDPLDGTAKFIRKLPFFGPCIALERAGELVLGVVYLPLFRELFWAEHGSGAFLNGQPIHVSAVAALDQAYVSHGYERDFFDRGMGATLTRLAHGVRHNPGFLDLYSYVSVACGRIDAVAMLNESPWDIAAHRVIVEEAGGRLTDFDGIPTITGTSTLATNGLLHEDLRRLIAGAGDGISPIGGDAE